MRIKIVSDGRIENTHIYNAETGEELKGVCAVWIKLSAGSSSMAILEIANVPLEIEALAVERKLLRYSSWWSYKLAYLIAWCSALVDRVRPWIKTKKYLRWTGRS